MPAYLIDTETKSWHYAGKLRKKTSNGHKAILTKLGKLKTTASITDYGSYRQCPEYSLIELETSLTEEQLESYLSKNNLAYIGIVLKN